MRALRTTALIVLAIVVVAALAASGCCAPRPGGLVISSPQDDALNLASLANRYGSPTSREITTAGALVRRTDLTIADILATGPRDDRLRTLLARLPADRAMVWVVWQRSCWFEITDRFAGAFDPTSGRPIEVDGEPIVDVWTQTS